MLAALPIAPTERDAGGGPLAWGDFALAPAEAAHPPTRGLAAKIHRS